MELISQDALKAKLDRGDHFKLIMVLGEWAFRAQHIPGSIHMNKPEEAGQLDPNEEIVVYCSGGACAASKWAYNYLVSRGFTRVSWYAGGLEEWAAAGYPLEGEMVST